jgi:uncharacterized protein (TIGR02246 family)
VRSRSPAPLALVALLAVSACAGSGGAPAATGTPEDEQAIRGITTAYAAAYSAKDTAAFAALMVDDYHAVDPTGRHLTSKADAVAAAVAEFAMMPAGVSVSMSATTDFIKFIDANHAMAGGTWSISPSMPGMPSKGSWLAVAVKQGTEWKTMSAMGAPDLSGMMPPPPPPPTRP